MPRHRQLRPKLESVPSSGTPSPLLLDEKALDAVDEAWVPVIIGVGRGVLMWENSD